MFLHGCTEKQKKKNNDGEGIFLTILFLPAETFFFLTESGLQLCRFDLNSFFNTNSGESLTSFAMR